MIKFNGKEYVLGISTYGSYDFLGNPSLNLAILLYEKRETNLENYEAVITVNFGEFISVDNSAYLDTNNYPNIDEILEKSGYGKRTSFTHTSGYCTYPLFVFDEEKLKGLTLGKEFYEQYVAKTKEINNFHF